MGDNNRWQRIRSPAAAGARETKPTNTNQDNRSSWWDYAAGASALLIFTSGLIYVLGLLTLWTPIAMTNTDYLTAWHAASLVPKTVVAGLGVQQLVAFPLLAGTIIFVILYSLDKLGGPDWGFFATYVLVLGFSMWRIATGTSYSSPTLDFVGIMITILCFITIYLFLLALVAILVIRYRTGIWKANLIRSGAVFPVVLVLFYFFFMRDIAHDEGIDYLIDAAFIVGAGTIVWVGAALTGGGTAMEKFSASRLSWRGLQPYFIVLATAFVAAFMLTIPSRPALPSVEIDVIGKDKGTVKGKLLTHTDAFWHVFQPKKSRVTAIHDDEVKRVWVSKTNE